MNIKIKLHRIIKPENGSINIIIGMSHFIKTVEDIHEAIVCFAPSAKFGLAFAEASGDKLIRCSGTDKEMVELAKKNMKKIRAGHSFIIFLNGTYPLQILNAIKQVPEVCSIFCATANPVEVVIAETSQGRGIIGIIDGSTTDKTEKKKEVEERKTFLRKIGYKL